MTIWLPDLGQYNGPRYAAIAAAIGTATTDGTLAPGDRLPPQRELAYQLGITVGTVSRAYALAEQRGYVRGEVGRGTFVRNRASGMLGFDSTDVVDLSMNMPLSFPSAQAFKTSLANIAADPSVGTLLRYMPTTGHAEHRSTIADWISQTGFHAAPDNIVLTQGAQQGLASIFDVLARAGDTILVEELTYPGLIENARLKQIELEPVELDAQGMRPDALERHAKSSGAKVVIVVPTVQNPTAAIMGPERRAQIAEIAQRLDLTIIEDDVYGYLPAERPAPIATMAPDRTVYITSASKSLAPGLRVGWLVAPKRLVPAFTDLVYAQSVAQPALNVELIRRWIEDGTAGAIVSELRAETEARYALAEDILAGHRMRGHRHSFHVLLELPEPWRRDDFVSQAAAAGIKLSSIDAFVPNPRPAFEAVRLSLVCARDRPSLHAALDTLANLLRSPPRAERGIV